MSEDLMLNLKDGVKLNNFEIVPSFDDYSEFIQKTVVLCFLNKSLNVSINNRHLYDLVQHANTGSLSRLVQSLTPLADRVKDILNAEHEEDVISSVSFSLEELSEKSFKIYINIEKTDETEEEGYVVING